MQIFNWSMTTGALLLLPLILLLSPVIIPCWAAWRLVRGKCLRCDHMLTAYSNMPLVKESGGATLHRCPGCGTYYCVPFTGPIAVIKMTEEDAGRWRDEQIL
mgnify:CR=1 FL=1